MNIFEELKPEVQSQAYDYFAQNHPEILATFIGQTNKEAANKLVLQETKIRYAVADSPLLTEESIMTLLKDPDTSVKKKALQNPNTSPAIKTYIIENRIEIPTFASKNPTLNIHDAKALWTAFPNIAQTILTNQHIQEDTLEAIVQHVRQEDLRFGFYSATIHHKSCSTKILHILFDCISTTRSYAFLNDFLHHPQTDKDILMRWLTIDALDANKALRRGDILKEMQRRKYINKKELTQLVKNITARDNLI